MKHWTAAAALALLLVGCGEKGQEWSYQLYFCADPQYQVSGAAISSQPYTGGNDPTVDDLVGALLSGPTQDGLISPFPKGVSMRGWELEDGLLTLDFSEAYGGLGDISLTLADYCIVLTLSQLEGVEGVQIQSAGQTYPSRSHPILRPEEVLTQLTPTEELPLDKGEE